MLSDHAHAPCPGPTCEVPITCPQRLHLCRTFLAVAMSFVIQACTASAPTGTPIGPGSAPSTNPSFDAFDFCVRKTETSQHDCFEQAIQVNHLSLPAGTTTEQAFTKYMDCEKKAPPWMSAGAGGPDQELIVGNRKEQHAFQQNCFTSALK
jgi:hypothetical protein